MSTSAGAAGQSIAVIGSSLTAADYAALERCGIDRHAAERALLRRVDSSTGGELMGRNGSSDYGGIVFPYVWPGDQHVREYRLRRDWPEVENGKPRNKYLSPPGRGNKLYFVPGTVPEWLSDPNMPIVLVEGEKKTLATAEIAWHDLGDGADRPRWLSIGIAGVWSWKGKIGKVEGPNGERLDEVGRIADLSHIQWKKRVVKILSTRTSTRTTTSSSLAWP